MSSIAEGILVPYRPLQIFKKHNAWKNIYEKIQKLNSLCIYFNTNTYRKFRDIGIWKFAKRREMVP